MPLAAKRNKKYSYKDYLDWTDDSGTEIINGEIYDMSPAPSPEHQGIIFEISGQIRNFLRNTECRAFPAPFDVRFADGEAKDELIENVVQPDISIICDTKKIDNKGCVGAPDLIIEVTSPSTAGKDMREKYYLYEKHGVKEYWIVHPAEKVVTVYIQGGDGKYRRDEVYTSVDTIKARAVKGLKIELGSVFSEG